MDTDGGAPGAERPRLAMGLLRGAITVQLVSALFQPLLAGLYLEGEFDALNVHAANASAVGVLGLVVIGAALAHRLRGGHRWPVWAAIALFLAEAGQISLGYQRLLYLHVPLAVGILISLALLTRWSWTAGAAAGRTTTTGPPPDTGPGRDHDPRHDHDPVPTATPETRP
jgi:hypothetical protein